MDALEYLTLLALVATATAGGGAGARLWSTAGEMRVVVTVLLVVALGLAAVLGTAWSLRRASTPYW